MLETLYQRPWILILIVLVLAIWELIWKAFALWKSARKKQLGWFVVILIFNTAGILPIIYLLVTREKKKTVEKKKPTKNKVESNSK